MAFGIQDIHNAIRDVKIAGYQHDDIEAFIINTEDLHELFESRWEFSTGLGGGEELKIMGIKIIDSHHVQRGTILKTFKNDNQEYPLDYGNNKYAYQPTVSGSGSIFPNYAVPDGSGAIQGLDNLGTSTEQADATENLPVIEEEKEKKEPRHSTTRKVQLD